MGMNRLRQNYKVKIQTYVYRGSEAISKIAKMIRPIFVPNGYHKMHLRVYETRCDQTNMMISELINHWSENLWYRCFENIQ